MTDAAAAPPLLAVLVAGCDVSRDRVEWDIYACGAGWKLRRVAGGAIEGAGPVWCPADQLGDLAAALNREADAEDAAAAAERRA